MRGGGEKRLQFWKHFFALGGICSGLHCVVQLQIRDRPVCVAFMCCAAIEKEKRRFHCGLFVQIVYIIRKEFACSALWSLVCTERFSDISFTPRPVSFFFFVFVHTIASQVVIRFDDTFRSSNIDKVLWEEKASQVNLQSLPRLFVCRPVPPLNVHIELRVCFCLNRPHLSLARCCVSDILNLFLPHNTWTAAWKKRG